MAPHTTHLRRRSAPGRRPLALPHRTPPVEPRTHMPVLSTRSRMPTGRDSSAAPHAPVACSLAHVCARRHGDRLRPLQPQNTQFRRTQREDVLCGRPLPQQTRSHGHCMRVQDHLCVFAREALVHVALLEGAGGSGRCCHAWCVAAAFGRAFRTTRLGGRGATGRGGAGRP